MPRKVKLGIALTAAAALVVSGMLAAGSGGAVQAPRRQTRQELARRLLESGQARFMTAPARAYLSMVAGDSRTTVPEAAGPAQDQGGPVVPTRAAGTLPAAAFRNVRVNNPAADRRFLDQTTQSETAIAVHGDNVAVGYNDSQHTRSSSLAAGSSLAGFSWSADGGRTFHDGGALPNGPGQVNYGHPWLASDRAGTFYYATLASDRFFNFGVSVARSNNGGKSWEAPRAIVDTSRFASYTADKEAITTGRDPQAAGRDNLYVAWSDQYDDLSGAPFLGLPVARSSDGARTWRITYADKLDVFHRTGCTIQQYLGAQPFADPQNGTLYVVAERIVTGDPDCVRAPEVRSVVIFKSTDGGGTFGPRVTIATTAPAARDPRTLGDVLYLGPGEAIRTRELPTIAQVGGTLFVAWNDGAQGRSHIRLASSTDGGAHWTVGWATGGAHHDLQPALSGDAAGLHLLYYQVDPSNRINVLLQERAGGRTTVRRVNTVPFPGVPNAPQFDPVSELWYMGDYIANVSDGAHRFFAWGDNRNIVRNYLWPRGRNDPDVFYARD